MVDESDAAPALGVLVDVIGDLETNSSDPARILRRVMTHVVEILCADMAMVVRSAADGSYEPIRAMGSVEDPEVAEHVLARLPRPLPGERALLDGGLVSLPLDTYHLVALVGDAGSADTENMYLVELITRHAGQALENARLRDELAQSEHLSTVGKAVRRVLHDLRNPIGRIHVAVDRATVPGTDAETLQRMHAIISSAADDVLNIANEVSDFTNADKLAKIRITAESLLAALRDSCARLQLDLQCINEHSGAIHCDPQKLLRALTRLIESAYGPERVAPGRAEDTPGDTVVEVRIFQDGAGTVITVGDDGPGIPEPVRTRIFEPFANHGQPGPRGLGLAIVRSIIHAHGGEVSVHGDAQQSWFALRLPSSAAE